jgi:hypothetical protein
MARGAFYRFGAYPGSRELKALFKAARVEAEKIGEAEDPAEEIIDELGERHELRAYLGLSAKAAAKKKAAAEKGKAAKEPEKTEEEETEDGHVWVALETFGGYSK